MSAAAGGWAVARDHRAVPGLRGFCPVHDGGEGGGYCVTWALGHVAHFAYPDALGRARRPPLPSASLPSRKMAAWRSPGEETCHAPPASSCEVVWPWT